jgi:hypothetical protein
MAALSSPDWHVGSEHSDDPIWLSAWKRGAARDGTRKCGDIRGGAQPDAGQIDVVHAQLFGIDDAYGRDAPHARARHDDDTHAIRDAVARKPV